MASKQPRISAATFRQFYVSRDAVDVDFAKAQATYGDGYDRMGVLEGLGWKCIAGWGRDGWDMLDWPYYMAYVRRMPNAWEVATDCEGDWDHWVLPTRAVMYQLLNWLAFSHWKHHGAQWVEGIESVDVAPAYLLGPYSSDRHESPLNPVVEP